MKLVEVVILMLIALVPECALALDTYQCTSQFATGFAMDATTKKWKVAQFQGSGPFVLVKDAQDKWSINADTGIPYSCNDNGREIFCSVGPLVFRMNKHTERFLHAHLEGFFTDYEWLPLPEPFGSKEGQDTPFMEIGTCFHAQM